MSSYYWNKFTKWVNTPKADRKIKLVIIAVVVLTLLGAVGSAFAGDRSCGTCPAPTNPTTTTTSTTPVYETKSDSHSGRSFIITALIIAGAACAVSWDECKGLFTPEPSPVAADPNPESIVPATANPNQYDIKTGVSFQ